MKSLNLALATVALAAALSPGLAQAATYIMRVPVSASLLASSAPPASTGGLIYNTAAVYPTGMTLALGQVVQGTVCGGSSQCVMAAFTNTDATPVTVSSVTGPSGAFSSNAVYSYGQTPCTTGMSLPSGGSCYVGVGYNASTLGQQQSAITLTASDGSTATAPMSMTVVSALTGLYSSPSQGYNFGPTVQGSTASASSTFTVSDANSTTISSVVVSGPQASAFTTNGSCVPGASVSSSSGCSLSLSYTPQSSSDSATVTITASNGDSLAIPVTGSEVPGQVTTQVSLLAVNCTNTDPNAYSTNTTNYVLALDAVNGWGSAALQTIGNVSNDPSNVYGEISTPIAVSDSHSSTIVNAKFPFGFPTVDLSGINSSAYNGTDYNDTLTQSGPVQISLDLGDYKNGLNLVLPQSTPTDVSSKYSAASYCGYSTSTLTAYSETYCVNWAYTTTGYPASNLYNDTRGWVGTPKPGACH